MSKSRKSTKKNSRTRRKRGGAGLYSPKVVTCENLNSQLSQYREYIKILQGDDAQKWQGMKDDIKSLKVSLSNTYAQSKKRPIIRDKIKADTAEAIAFYNDSSSLSKLDFNLSRLQEDVGYGIAHYNKEIGYIKNKKEEIMYQGCKDPVEGGRKSRRKRRRRTNKRKSRRKSRRRKSTKKKRRRRRR
jgi:hypothetical protein